MTRTTMIITITLLSACINMADEPIEKDWTPTVISGTFDTNVLLSSGWQFQPGGAWTDTPPAELVLDAGLASGCIIAEFSAAASTDSDLSISLLDSGQEIARLDGYGSKIEQLRVPVEGLLKQPVILARLDGQDGDTGSAKALSWEVLAECP